MVRCRWSLAVIIALVGASFAAAQGAPSKNLPEVLPAPKVKAPIIIFDMPDMPRPGTRAAWQYYGIDSRGRFVPRVQYTPEGAFYLRDGQIYPWTTTRPLLWAPKVIE